MDETVISVLEEAASRYGERPALREKRAGDWIEISWQELRDRVMAAARGLIRLGVAPGDGLVILSANRPEWFMADLAAIAAGALPTGLYTTATPGQCGYVTSHCEATVAVVENLAHLAQLESVREGLRAVVMLDGDTDDEGLIGWRELLELGSEDDDGELRRRIDSLRPDDPCTLIYTSGTTGTPKGVMLSHTNLVWLAQTLVREFDVGADDHGISYLPLSHVAEQVVSLFTPIVAGATISFAESLEKLGENLREVRPTFFFAVPRVWEKIQAKMEAAGAGAGPLRRALVRWARRVGLDAGYADQQSSPRPRGYVIADRLVFSKVRQRLGFDRTRFCFTGAAPIAVPTLEFFLSLGIPLLEVYGMTESTGPTTFSKPHRYCTGCAGFPVSGTELRLEEDGEVCMRGPHVFLGYYKDPEATRAALDDEGWLHSGDVGAISDDGFLQVIDRKKELIITSGGKNVAPVPIENMLRTIPAVAQAVVVGESRNYLAALLTLDPEQLPVVAKRIGSAVRDAAAAASCSVFRSFLEQQIERINAKLASYETIKRFAVLADELSVEQGTLTPTLKLKRRVILRSYEREIEELYAT